MQNDDRLMFNGIRRSMLQQMSSSDLQGLYEDCKTIRRKLIAEIKALRSNLDSKISSQERNHTIQMLRKKLKDCGNLAFAIIETGRLNMVKRVCINTIYRSEKKIFNCLKEEFLMKVAEAFNIDVGNVLLLRVDKEQRCRISPADIDDLMKIEIMDKNELEASNRRGMRSDGFTVDTEPQMKQFVQNVITKLKNNSPLNGNERKTLVEWLETYPPNPSKKRKHEENHSNIEPPRKCNKKIQVESSFLTKVKESFSQTSPEIARFPATTETETEDISQKIKQLAYNGTLSEKEAAVLMAKSFDSRRNFILAKAPSVSLVKDKYPLLFSFNEVKRELDRIFFPGICVQFVKNMYKYSKHILNACDTKDNIYVRMNKSIERAHTEKQRKYAALVGSIFALAKVFDEDCKFIHLSDMPHGSVDVYPHIDASIHSLKHLFADNVLYRIFVEEQTLCEAPNFPEAILCLIGCFFIFNIKYPDNCCKTLTVFEKLFLCANDTTEIDDMTLQMIKLLQLKAKVNE